MFFEPVHTELILFFMLYGITGMVPLIAALYLLLRRGNAIAPGVTPPLQLRRWTAVFFAILALAHVWWLLFYIFSFDLQSVSYMVLALADCLLLFVSFAGMLLSMLQDRHRSVWPTLAAMIPFVLIGVAYMVYQNSLLEQLITAYLMLLGLGFTGYMMLAIRQYGRWLNDNYADLENKRVWLSQTVALVCMLLFVLYVLDFNIIFIWLIHIIELVLVGLLLWRVETLPNLEAPTQPLSMRDESGQTQGEEPSTPLAPSGRVGGEILSKIEQQLAERCIAPQLYLQHDLTLQQLAQAIGTNRFYLSQYFSHKGITYNTYINDLRINHFINRYHRAVAAGQSIPAQQLASESGFRSYSTFSLAFKQRKGQSVTAWMHDM